MTIARQIIQGALRLGGILKKSEPMTAEEAQDGLDALNQLLGSWSNEGLLITSRTEDILAVSSNVATYTIGTGQTWDTERPTAIIAAVYRQNGTDIDYPLTQLNDEEYALMIAQKNIQSSVPYYFNFNNAYPNSVIKLWPVPSLAGTFRMQSEKPITLIASINDTINMPSGWLRALRYNLALEICPEYDVEPSALVVKGANESKGAIKTQVARNRPIIFDGSGSILQYSIYADGYV